jgi:hypothetical protein
MSYRIELTDVTGEPGAPTLEDYRSQFGVPRSSRPDTATRAARIKSKVVSSTPEVDPRDQVEHFEGVLRNTPKTAARYHQAAADVEYWRGRVEKDRQDSQAARYDREDANRDASARKVYRSTGDLRKLGDNEIIEKALRIVDKDSKHFLKPKRAEAAERFLRADAPGSNPVAYARFVCASGDPDYVDVSRIKLTDVNFARGMGQLEPRHRAALERYELTRPAWEGRALNETGGGQFGVPYFITPEILCADGENWAPALDICQHDVLPYGQTYQAVATVSGSATYVAEAEATAGLDVTPTLTGPQLTMTRLSAFIPASRELVDDAFSPSNFQAAISAFFGQALIETLGRTTMTGAGGGPGYDPLGVQTQALAATTPAHVIVGSQTALTYTDIRALYEAIPPGYRADPTFRFCMHPTAFQALQASVALGTAGYDIHYSPTDDQPRIFGREVILSDHLHAFTGTSSGGQAFVTASTFSKFLFVTKLGGSTLELIPSLPSPSTTFPTGQVGFFSNVRLQHQLVSPLAAGVLSST